LGFVRPRQPRRVEFSIATPSTDLNNPTHTESLKGCPHCIGDFGGCNGLRKINLEINRRERGTRFARNSKRRFQDVHRRIDPPPGSSTDPSGLYDMETHRRASPTASCPHERTEVEYSWVRGHLSFVGGIDGTLYRFTSRVRRRSAWPPAAPTKPSRPSDLRNRDRPAVGPIGGQCSDFAEKCEPNGPFWLAAVVSPRAPGIAGGATHLSK